MARRRTQLRGVKFARLYRSHFDVCVWLAELAASISALTSIAGPLVVVVVIEQSMQHPTNVPGVLLQLLEVYRLVRLV